MKRSEKQAPAFVRNAVNIARSLSLSRQDGVSREADIKIRSEIQGSKFPFAGGFSFLGQLQRHVDEEEEEEAE